MLQRMTLGMIAVALDHVLDVALRPVAEVEAVVVRGLGLGPGVERLVQDQDAEAVGDVEQLGRGRVVRGADGVHAHALQDLHLAFDGAVVDGGAERAEIVVHVHARGSSCSVR